MQPRSQKLITFDGNAANPTGPRNPRLVVELSRVGDGWHVTRDSRVWNPTTGEWDPAANRSSGTQPDRHRLDSLQAVAVGIAAIEREQGSRDVTERCPSGAGAVGSRRSARRAWRFRAALALTAALVTAGLFAQMTGRSSLALLCLSSALAWHTAVFTVRGRD